MLKIEDTNREQNFKLHLCWKMNYFHISHSFLYIAVFLLKFSRETIPPSRIHSRYGFPSLAFWPG